MIGLVSAILAAAAIAWSVVLVRRSLEESSILRAALAVAVIGNVVVWPFALMFASSLVVDSSSLILFCVSGVLAPGVARLLFYRSMNTLGVTVTSAIFSTSPLYSSILALFVLNEVMSVWDWIGMALIVVGIVYFQRGSEGSKTEKRASVKGLVLALLAASVVALSQVILKYGLNVANEPVLGAAVGYMSSLLFYLLLTPFLGSGKPNVLFKNDLRLFWKAGLVFAIGWLLNFYSLSVERASVVASLIQIQPLFVAGFAYLYIRQLERIRAGLLVSVVIVVLGVVFIGM